MTAVCAAGGVHLLLPLRSGAPLSSTSPRSLPGAGMVVTLEIRDPHVELVNVVDRGIEYGVPSVLRGSRITPHPLNVGLLGLSCLEASLVDARKQLNPPTSFWLTIIEASRMLEVGCRGRPLLEVNRTHHQHRKNDAFDPVVWSGRALQVDSPSWR